MPHPIYDQVYDLIKHDEVELTKGREGNESYNYYL